MWGKWLSLCVFQSCSNSWRHTHSESHALSEMYQSTYVSLWPLFLTSEFYPDVLFSFSRLEGFFQVRVKCGSAPCHVKFFRRCDFKRSKDSAQFSSVQFSRSVVSDSLRSHESQHARPPCPSPTPGVHSDSRPSSHWCHPAISSFVSPVEVNSI